MTVEPGQIQLNQGQIMYPLPVDTIDLLDMVTRTGTGQNQQDININRISESTYITIPNKNATGRPIQVWINRQSGQENPTDILLNETLTGTNTTADDTITLTSTVGLAQFGFIKIGVETIQYGGKMPHSRICRIMRLIPERSLLSLAAISVSVKPLFFSS